LFAKNHFEFWPIALPLVINYFHRELLVNEGYDPVYGARPIKRAIQRYLENPLSMEILKGAIRDGDSVKADVKGDKIVFN